MASDASLDYAVFQLSPRRSHCELFVSYDGITEKLASGLVKPFVTHLKVVEEQVALDAASIKLEVEGHKDAETWFTKATLERFVLFVSTPEVLEMVSTFDVEMSQLEVARKIYSQGSGDHQHSPSSGGQAGATVPSDATKKELLRAIDVRLAAVKQDLTTACGRASDAGFNPESVIQLQHFADCFGAHSLSETCRKFMELTNRRPDIFPNTTTTTNNSQTTTKSLSDSANDNDNTNKSLAPTTSTTNNNINAPPTESQPSTSTHSSLTPQLTRRLSVQERINLFENKQKQNSPSIPVPPPPSSSSSSTGVKPELRRLSSDVTSSPDKTVLKRWSGVSDMSIDVNGDKTQPDSNANTPTPTSSSILHVNNKSKGQDDLKGKEVHQGEETRDYKFLGKEKSGSSFEDPSLSVSNSKSASHSGRSSKTSSFGGVEDFGFGNQTELVHTQFKSKPGKTEQLGTTVDQTSQNKEKSSSGGGNRQLQATERGFRGSSFGGESEDDLMMDQSVPRLQFRTTQKRTSEVATDSAAYDPPSRTVIQNKGGVDYISVEPVDQVQRVRPSKGNQGLNDELQTKANELEKLFAKHKLRVPAVQLNSSRKNGPAESPKQQKVSSVNRKLVPEISPMQSTMEVETAADSCDMKFSSIPSSKAVNRDYDITPNHNSYSLNALDELRGKSYQKYMQKRNAKLKEDWRSKSAEKQAKMEALQDSLERSRAEMMTKLAGSTDKRNIAHRQTRKKSSSNDRSAIKREQQVESFMSDEDEDQNEFLGKKLRETFLGDSSSRNTQTKKALSNKSATSSSSRNSSTHVTRSSGKAPNSTTGRRRLNSDNPLAQSVPNLSELRKENTKPSSGGSKPVRAQGRNNIRKKSSTEDLQLTNEEKPRRSQFSRKNSSNGRESNDPCNYDSFVGDEKFLMHMESKSSLKRANSIECASGSGSGRLNASVMMEDVRNGDKFDDEIFENEEVTNAAQEDDDDDLDDFETSMRGEYASMDNAKERQSHGSDKSTNSGYENSRYSETGGPASGTELPMSMPSLSHTMGSIQDSPGESPGSWNSRVQNPYSFSHEVSDIDASDSPLGSPASWNFHNLAQTESEAARMRKKWGAAQKPILSTDSSHSRKDVSKGLKRFLKFGRKNRATESVADWISVTTSEGDDDNEDGRDYVYRSSEDLRKSRMGFSHSSLLSDDGFIESDSLNDQVNALQSSIPTSPANFKLRDEHMSSGSQKAPKSFFSLSNFRSKANESKPR